MIVSIQFSDIPLRAWGYARKWNTSTGVGSLEHVNRAQRGSYIHRSLACIVNGVTSTNPHGLEQARAQAEALAAQQSENARLPQPELLA